MYMMIILTAMLIMTTKYPLPMGITLLITALTTSSATLMMMNSPWYPLIFFIIMVGGVLVLFLYMASISPNSMSSSYIMGPLIATLFVSMMLKESSKMNQLSPSLPSTKILFSSSNSWFIPILAMYLLMTMILIIKITNKNKTPLRKI